jgi:hypothetical protein
MAGAAIIFTATAECSQNKKSLMEKICKNRCVKNVEFCHRREKASEKLLTKRKQIRQTIAKIIQKA